MPAYRSNDSKKRLLASTHPFSIGMVRELIENKACRRASMESHKLFSFSSSRVAEGPGSIPSAQSSGHITKEPTPETADSDSDVSKMGTALADVLQKLRLTFRNKESYRSLLRFEGDQAQEFLDLFQHLLDCDEIDKRDRKDLIVATQRLSVKSGLHPACYELKDWIAVNNLIAGAGASADVYKGSFQGKPLCLKVMRIYQETQIEHAINQFSKEVVLWRQLSHDNIVPMYGLYRFGGRPCLVTPWMEHGDVTKYLELNLNCDRNLLVMDVARGLEYLHKNGIVHGDLKGANILVDDEGRACVADFGISSVSDPQILKWTTHSSASSKGGSVRWQAPELFDMEGDEDVSNTTASDVYAWACVAYEIFTGRVPFDHIHRDATVMYKVKSGMRPTRPLNERSVSYPIWTIMEQCWSQIPAFRPPTTYVVDELESIFIPQLSTQPLWHSPQSFMLEWAKHHCGRMVSLEDT